MVIFLIAWILFVVLCWNLFGIAGVPIGIISVIIMIVYMCYQEEHKKESEKTNAGQDNNLYEGFCTPIVSDDVLAMYCAEKVVNERFKL